MPLTKFLVAVLVAGFVLLAHATPFGHTRFGSFETVNGSPAICIPDNVKNSFSVGRATLSESNVQRSGFWGVVLDSKAVPLTLMPGKCFVYGVVPDGYGLESFGANEVSLVFEKNKTYVFRLTEASGSNDVYRVVFCVGMKADGDFEFFEYTRQPNGREVIPSCGQTSSVDKEDQ